MINYLKINQKNPKSYLIQIGKSSIKIRLVVIERRKESKGIGNTRKILKKELLKMVSQIIKYSQLQKAIITSKLQKQE